MQNDTHTKNRMKKEKSKKISLNIKFCPKCKSSNLVLAGGEISGLLQCKKCGFASLVFSEMTVKIKGSFEKRKDEREKAKKK